MTERRDDRCGQRGPNAWGRRLHADGGEPSHPATEPIEALCRRIGRALGAHPLGATELDGGMVGTVYRVTFAERPAVAAKVDTTPLGTEAAMLGYLARRTTLPVPTVEHVEPGLLVLAFVEGDGAFDERAQRSLARRLARLHDVSGRAYGFPFDTVSGPFRQRNPWTESWIDFFRDRRLLPYARAAHEEGPLRTATLRRIERLAADLEARLVEPDAPALVHGDVHPGNLVVREGAVRAVLDPAIYFGHDEVDLSYVLRSEAVGDPFLAEYRRHRSIDPGFVTERRRVYEAFHTLENLRFFGADRRPRLEDALDDLRV